MFQAVTTVSNVSSLLHELYIRKESGEKMVINSTNFRFRFYFRILFFLLYITNVDRPYYPDICIDIDIADAVVDTGIRSITFLIGELSNYGVHLEITDKVTSDFWMLV